MGEFTFLPQEKIIFGPGSLEKLRQVVTDLGKHRALVITGHSLSTSTPLVKQVEELLGENHAGTYSGIRQHAPESNIDEAVQQAIGARADLLIGLGGGSPIDAAKITAHKLSIRSDGEGITGEIRPIVAIPTTLSAAEYSPSAGYTDESSQAKMGISEVRLTPRVVILDPRLSLWTPMELWLGSGLRSLDHAIETLYSPGEHPINDVLALRAIELIFRFLPLSKAEPKNVDVRLQCQLAAWMSYFAPANAASAAGLSHTIGKRIGATYRVPHGVTSAILLSHVIRYKASRTEDAARLAPAAQTLGLASGAVADREAALAVADAVQALVQQLGLPSCLREVNVQPETFESIARASAKDDAGRAIVMDILRQAY